MVTYLDAYRRTSPALQSGLALRHRSIRILSEWIRRVRSRRELASLSDNDVKDLGYPATLEAEKSKPFWEL
jgi:uncharacterized protein YjiS (DUF1127 family)